MPIEDEGFELMALLGYDDTDSGGPSSADENELTGVVVEPRTNDPRINNNITANNNEEPTQNTIKELFEALKQNNVDEVERILSLDKAAATARLGTDELTTLHVAALLGNKRVLNILLELGVKPKLVDREGRTALHLAAWMGHTDCVETLQARCPELAKKVVKKSNYCTNWTGGLFMPQDRDALGDIPPLGDGLTPLHLASQRAHIECVRVLLTAEADCNALDSNKLTPLDVAGEKIPKNEYGTGSERFLQVIHTLIRAGGKPTSKKDAKYRETPMHIAVSMKCMDAIPVLATAGYNTPLGNKSGNTPLHVAIYHRLEQPCPLIELLPVYGQSGLECKNKEGETPLHVAVQKQWLFAVEKLLIENALITAVDNKGKTVLHMAAAKKNHVIMKELLKHPDSDKIVNVKDSGGNTALLLSIHMHCKCVAELLSHKELDLTIRDSKNRTVLHCAVENKDITVLKALFEKRNGEMVEMINDTTSTDPQEPGQTALHIAACKNNSKGTQILVDNRCIVQAKTKYNERTVTALQIATINGHEEVVKILLKADPSLVHVSDEQGMRPIHWACISRDSKIITMLVNAGSNLAAKCTYPEKGVTSSAMDLLIHRVPCSVDLLNASMDSSFTVKKTFIEIDYKILLPTDSDLMIQMKTLTALVDTGDKVNQRSLFMHPLIDSFLYLQWKRIEVFYYILIFVYTLFVIPFSVLVLIIFNSKDNELFEEPLYGVNMFLRAIIALSSIIHIAHQVLYMYYKALNVGYKTYDLYYKTNKPGWFKWEFPTKSLVSIIKLLFGIFEIVFTLMIFIIIVTDPTDEAWFNREIATAAILLFYVKFMKLVSKVPTYGFYMLMFFEVTSNFAVVLLSFTFLIVGFMITFFIEFKAKQPFDSGWEAIFKTIVMMTNEFEYQELFTNYQGNMLAHLFTKLVFILFLLLVGIVIMNILLAKAISDVKKVDRLRKQAQFLGIYEMVLCLPFSYFKSKPIERKQIINFDKDVLFPEKLMHTILDKAFKVSKATKEQYKETQKRKILNHQNSLKRNNYSNESSLHYQSNEQNLVVEIKTIIELLTKKMEQLSETAHTFQKPNITNNGIGPAGQLGDDSTRPT